jgi:hypothetical protein
MDVIDLLKKLIAQEEGERAVGNLAAAETFAAKCQELLFKHKLDMSDVELAAEEAEEPIASEVLSVGELLDLGVKQQNWAGVLLGGISKANFCKVIRTNANRYSVVGRNSDRKVVSALFLYLSKAAIEMAPREASAEARYNPGCNRVSFVRSFKFGFAQAICERLRIKVSELKAGAGEQGLMRIDQMERKVKAVYEDLYPNARKSTASCRQNSGYTAGKAYGHAVGINSTLRLSGRR